MLPIAIALGWLAAATGAHAYDARVSWRPVAGAAGYALFVAYDSGPAGAPRDVGAARPDASGTIRVVVSGLPLGPTANVTAVSYAADGTRSTVSNRLTLTYAGVAAVVDSDRDGLTDADEDKDLDRVVDPGETDPQRADSDGDGALDGAEVAAGTNPRDPISVPPLETSIWIPASAATLLRGAMRLDTRYAAGNDRDATADALMDEQLAPPDGSNSFAGDSGDEAVYALDLPVAGQWYLWGRFYYPGAPGSNDANSFHAVVDGREPLDFGNNKDYFRKWHWDGDGGGEGGPPIPLALGSLGAGRHTLVVEKREAAPEAPRLDALMLAPSPGTLPTDAAARRGLGVTSGGTGGAPACDDAGLAAGTCQQDAGVWLAASAASRLRGDMKLDTRYAAGKDADGAADALLPAQLAAADGVNAFGGHSGDQAVFQVDLPVGGRWYLWGRFYYPGQPGSNDANSFHARVDSGKLLPLGNNKDFFRRWHWDGDGGYEAGPPIGLPLGSLAAGRHTLVIEKREAVPDAPRLDALVLTLRSSVPPTDADARSGLGLSAASTLLGSIAVEKTPADERVAHCGSDAECDDEIFCTADFCDSDAGVCRNMPFDAFCDDGNACNGTEKCDASIDCRPGVAIACDDGVVCNGQETCEPDRGCVAGEPPDCDYGVGCTLAACSEDAGGCTVVARPGACDDGNPCTVDRCTGRGCAYAPGTGSCDDGLACTTGDACSGGECLGRDTCGAGMVCLAETGDCAPVPGDPDRDGLGGAEDPCPIDARNRCFGPVAVDQGGTEIRVNAHPGGGLCAGVQIDCNGDAWARDFGYDQQGEPLVGGQARDDAACSLAGVADVFACASRATEDIFRCSHRASGRGSVLSYSFAVADGDYLVNLYFANFDAENPGENVYRLRLEGAALSADVDLVSEGATPGHVLVRSAPVSVRDGDGLQIAIEAVVGHADLSAIEVLKAD